jgi:ABC-type Zn2+ transport system substrate-binding protein/surface adhesin
MATSFFEQAKSLFPLDKRAEAATESSWETYITNRSVAENKFPGCKKTGPKSATDEEGEDDVTDDEDHATDDEDHATDDEDEYDPRGGELDFLYALNLIRRRMASLEKELELGKGVLLRSFRVLSCDPLFRTADEVFSVFHPSCIFK